jgi:hypothetical protein
MIVKHTKKNLIKKIRMTFCDLPFEKPKEKEEHRKEILCLFRHMLKEVPRLEPDLFQQTKIKQVKKHNKAIGDYF